MWRQRFAYASDSPFRGKRQQSLRLPDSRNIYRVAAPRSMQYCPAHAKPKEAVMQSLISDLVARFERGQLSRRDFVGTLAALAATGPAAAAPAPQAELDFRTAIIDHLSI